MKNNRGIAMKPGLDLLNQCKVGIIGCGHLGMAIAETLVKRGVEKGNLLLTHRDSVQTRKKIEECQLGACLATNRDIAMKCGLLLITVKPQDLASLDKNMFSSKTVVASCMAGVPRNSLIRLFGPEVRRMMFSGPDTIVAGTGIATVYPGHERLEALLSCMGLTQVPISSEDDIDVFTAGVCLPAAIVKITDPETRQDAMKKIGKEYPLLADVYAWAEKNAPGSLTATEAEEYIKKMVTKGGVTEAILTGLNAGATLDVALRMGIERTKEISEEIRHTLGE